LAFDVDEEQMTGLHWGAREGNATICRILLQKYRANCHSKDCYGRTPLHLAVENKHVECIVRIFIEGGHLNALNKDHKTVRMVANNAYIKYLVEKL
jgi:ankyrin repeat protein